MTFSIIGTGNIAWFIGNRLVAARHQCMGVFGRNETEVERLAEALLSSKYGDIKLAAETEADVCFLAVSDDAIADVAAQLNYKETVLIHTSGAMSLESIAAAAADTALLWPVYSISGQNPPIHRNIPTAWEASSKRAERFTLTLAHAITDVLFEAKFEQRKWLHLTAVISNNFTNHLMSICEMICAENNLPFSALEPIIDQTFMRMKQFSPQLVQTGPAVRNDKHTIDEQINLLGNHPVWQDIYKSITKSIQETLVHDKTQ